MDAARAFYQFPSAVARPVFPDDRSAAESLAFETPEVRKKPRNCRSAVSR